MMLRRPAVAMLLVCALVFAACNGGGDDDDPTPTPVAETPDVTAVASSTPGSISDEIRSLDLEASEPVAALLDDTGGSYVQSSVLYADVTDDGAEDAIVPISSGGTAGDVAVIVLASTGDGVEEVLMFEPEAGGGLVVNIEEGKLVVTEPVPGPDDPECCPSQFRRTVYGWDGDSLEQESSTTTESAPDSAPPPSSGQ